MTAAMALTRAIGGGILPAFTHMGAVSGGSWFAVQLVYGEQFYNDVLNPQLPIEAVVVDWGARYSEAFESAVQLEVPWAVTVSSNSECEKAEAFVENVLVPLVAKGIDLPGQHWLPFTTALLYPFVPGIENGTFATMRASGLATVKLVQGAALAPDAWIGPLNDSTAYDLRGITVDGGGDSLQGRHSIIPLAHVSSATSAGEWLLPADGLSSAGVPFTLPADPLVAEVSSASSSAYGYFSSPTLVEQMLGPGGVDASDAAKAWIDACWPLGFEYLAGAMLEDGAVPPAGWLYDPQSHFPEGQAKYRYLDGCYSDDTAAAVTLGQMMADCAAGELDCSGDVPYKLLIVDDGGDWENLFSSYGVTPGTSGMSPCSPSMNTPSTTIFQETLPSNWTELALTVLQPHQEADFRATTVTSWYWRGVLTTVANDDFGVAAGQKVAVLMINAGFDDTEAIVWSAKDRAASRYFNQVYGPFAQALADAAEPVVQAWLADMNVTHIV